MTSVDRAVDRRAVAAEVRADIARAAAEGAELRKRALFGGPTRARWCIAEDCDETLGADDAACPWCHTNQAVEAARQIGVDLGTTRRRR